MASKIIDSLLASGLSLEKMITISRDNPSVMKCLDKKFKEKAEAELRVTLELSALQTSVIPPTLHYVMV